MDRISMRSRTQKCLGAGRNTPCLVTQVYLVADSDRHWHNPPKLHYDGNEFLGLKRIGTVRGICSYRDRTSYTEESKRDHTSTKWVRYLKKDGWLWDPALASLASLASHLILWRFVSKGLLKSNQWRWWRFLQRLSLKLEAQHQLRRCQGKLQPLQQRGWKSAVPDVDAHQTSF